MIMPVARAVSAFAMATGCATAGCGDGSPAGGGPPGSRVASQSVAEGQNFRFSLNPGTYRLSVQGVDGDCVKTDVTVTAAQDRVVELVCPRK